MPARPALLPLLNQFVITGCSSACPPLAVIMLRRWPQCPLPLLTKAHSRPTADIHRPHYDRPVFGLSDRSYFVDSTRLHCPRERPLLETQGPIYCRSREKPAKQRL